MFSALVVARCRPAGVRNAHAPVATVSCPSSARVTAVSPVSARARRLVESSARRNAKKMSTEVAMRLELHADTCDRRRRSHMSTRLFDSRENNSRCTHARRTYATSVVTLQNRTKSLLIEKFHYIKTLSGKVVAQSIAFRVISIYWLGVAPFP